MVISELHNLFSRSRSGFLHLPSFRPTVLVWFAKRAATAFLLFVLLAHIICQGILTELPC